MEPTKINRIYMDMHSTREIGQTGKDVIILDIHLEDGSPSYRIYTKDIDKNTKNRSVFEAYFSMIGRAKYIIFYSDFKISKYGSVICENSASFNSYNTTFIESEMYEGIMAYLEHFVRESHKKYIEMQGILYERQSIGAD
jgi:hypothetical protein